MKSLITDRKLLKNGGRKATLISATELEAKIIKRATALDEDTDDLHSAVAALVYNDSKIRKDLSKVDFDFENIDVGDDGFLSNTGFRKLENGFTYLLCAAGGDWETPVGFIIYWDGKSLRGYIPTLGNTFNLKYKCAFGSEENHADDYDEVCDEIFDEFEYDDTFCGEPPYFVKMLKESSTPLEDYDGEYDLDLELFEEDIAHRIIIDGLASQQTTSAKKNNAQESSEVIPKCKTIVEKNSNGTNCTVHLVSLSPLDGMLLDRIASHYNLSYGEKIEFFQTESYQKVKECYRQKVKKFSDLLFEELFSETKEATLETIGVIADYIEKKQSEDTDSSFDDTSDASVSDTAVSDTQKQYYWQFTEDTDGYDIEEEFSIYVAEKTFWEEENCLDDRELTIPELDRLGFLETCESTYEITNKYKGEKTKEGVRKALNSLPNFTEHKMF